MPTADVPTLTVDAPEQHKRRWLGALLVCGLLPLLAANVIGIRTADCWRHGWPATICFRTERIYVDSRRYLNNASTLPVSSCWIFDRADRMWRVTGFAWLLVCGTWMILLVGTAHATWQSRFVRLGQPQIGLGTLLVATTVAGVLLGRAVTEGTLGWQSLLPLPPIVGALLGYASLFARPFRLR